MERLRKTFSIGRMRYGETGKEESKAVKEYKELFTKQNELFDVYAEGPEIKKKLEKEWGVSMSEMEYSTTRTRRQKTRCFVPREKRERDQQFSYKSLDAISHILI